MSNLVFGLFIALFLIAGQPELLAGSAVAAGLLISTVGALAALRYRSLDILHVPVSAFLTRDLRTFQPLPR